MVRPWPRIRFPTPTSLRSTSVRTARGSFVSPSTSRRSRERAPSTRPPSGRPGCCRLPWPTVPASPSCSRRCTRRFTTPPSAAAGSTARYRSSCGWLLVLPPRFFRAFHLEHHRYTQDPERDPELADAPLCTWRQYLWRVSGAQYWVRQFRVLARFAAGAGDGALDSPRRAPRSRSRGSRVPCELRRGRRALGGGWQRRPALVLGRSSAARSADAEALPDCRAHRLSDVTEHAREPRAPCTRTPWCDSSRGTCPTTPSTTRTPRSRFTRCRAPTPPSPHSSATSRADTRACIGTSPAAFDRRLRGSRSISPTAAGLPRKR